MNELRTILPYFRPYRTGAVAGLALVVVTNLFTVAGPYLIKLSIDGLGDPDVTMGRISTYALLLVVAAFLGGAAKYGMRELLNGLSRRIECDLRNDYFAHLLRLDAGFYGRTRTGDLMARATNDTQAVRMATGPAIMYAVNTFVSFLLTLGLMVWISPRLTVYALVPMVVLPPVVFMFARVIHRRFEKIQEQFSTLSTMVQENLTGMRIVQAYVQEDSQAHQFDELNREYMDRNMDLVKVAGLFHPILALFSGAAMVIVLWVGGLEVIAGRITTGDYVAFGIYVAYLIWPLIALGWVVNLFQRGSASMGRLNKIFETEPAVRPPENPVPLAEPRGAVEFRNVSFRYPGTERLVLEDVSFSADPGQTVAVVGPTGSGKSTLVTLIPRIYDVTSGRVLVDGVDVRDLDSGELRSLIGMVPQDPFLFSATIEENIGLGLGIGLDLGAEEPGAEDEDPDEVVLEAARVAQLHMAIEGFPKGWGTLLGERGVNLSGGQKQRTTLARAVARDPRILVLDDALSAVDTHTEARILDDLAHVMEGRTSFIISHRVSAVMNADLILVLDGGRMVERGRHTELMALGGTYAQLLHRQMLEQDIESRTVGVK
ncbi:MAG TPA: ABC transporter ATP-binding protein [Gemmatimonadetes bacterium]|uniref:ABC transmembrane type-1 domain-containing protein n=1 Tax=marine metagenome TaxID=408172 RepID=A0A381R1M6_9ZZZZ|nr:ABC transporter ATP-binding protein [Gemmatimonadota bacterium]|tara:strand:- start:193 stop:1995 length:1803 start_codon:yes stop_codon:yes gene_type:complete